MPFKNNMLFKKSRPKVTPKTRQVLKRYPKVIQQLSDNTMVYKSSLFTTSQVLFLCYTITPRAHFCAILCTEKKNSIVLVAILRDLTT